MEGQQQQGQGTITLVLLNITTSSAIFLYCFCRFLTRRVQNEKKNNVFASCVRDYGFLEIGFSVFLVDFSFDSNLNQLFVHMNVN